ncbi:hypothetical protein HMPREF9318_00072 [Streptococcus urinalis FB127-CNA-2]|uniref:Crossover junction endodeoxyribonuclease RusA n=1 Tax=Streptococcus urinalis 2285-97 TaxID=764291 RepID=G5KEH8_9STRE|nr:RusA family crossover junction endodeoxyribonuclease [Streptococcus urinalis]QBX22136.1 holliday junction resolvase [Streptococcus phage Javan637]QBX31592.1 holliday junction resolvase [Streptococcus phage Javan642]QBX31663.1 holliday junction resolvase [Streptococcus phage Javan648]EHJ56865.1 crossover junction endodeoxyribonuclease RusA [Streptococcus urinalis 2285-97]EKS21874.1 hypothetical protein HMPREF9318_00072 [Streptococcus urinalis FB127-CNA-2]
MSKLNIPIEPKPQMRPRFSKFGTYENPDMAKWRKRVTQYIIENYDGDYFDGATSVEVTFYMKAPKTVSKEPTQRSRSKARQIYQNFISERIWHDKKIDIDNLIKAVFDSISKSEIVWKDDNLVCELHAKKLYSPNPRIEMEITQIDIN